MADNYNNNRDNGFPQSPILPPEYVCTDVYTVNAGDTLYAISQSYGIPVTVLMQANRILNPYNLKIGQKICIPGPFENDQPEDQGASPSNDQDIIIPELNPGANPGIDPGMVSGSIEPENTGIELEPVPTEMEMQPAPVEDCSGIVHIIAEGDTLYMIAKSYQITLEALMAANPALDPYDLRVGDQLCIPTVMPLPADIAPEIPTQYIEDEDGDDFIDPPSGRGSFRSGAQNTYNSSGLLYHAQDGDTLPKIMKKFGVNYYALKTSNPDIDFSQKLGSRTLCIPPTDESRICATGNYYVTAQGDTLESVSEKLLVMSDSLLMANPMLTTNDFSVPGTKVNMP